MDPVTNKPVGNGCYKDMNVVATAWPKLTWNEACLKFHSDKAFKLEYNKSVKVWEQRMAGQQVIFSPPATVLLMNEHLTETYFEVAFCTESDVVRLTQFSPATLGLKSKVTIKIEDGSTLSGFLISMRGLPYDEIASLRKIKISSVIKTHLQEILQSADRQLRQDQGTEIYEIASEKLANHPNWIKSAARAKHQKFSDLKEKADAILEEQPLLF